MWRQLTKAEPLGSVTSSKQVYYRYGGDKAMTQLSVASLAFNVFVAQHKRPIMIGLFGFAMVATAIAARGLTLADVLARFPY